MHNFVIALFVLVIYVYMYIIYLFIFRCSRLSCHASPLLYFIYIRCTHESENVILILPNFILEWYFKKKNETTTDNLEFLKGAIAVTLIILVCQLIPTFKNIQILFLNGDNRFEGSCDPTYSFTSETTLHL